MTHAEPRRRLAWARLVKRQTDDGLVEIQDFVPLGKLYQVDLDSEQLCELHHIATGRTHTKTLLWAKQEDGQWRWLARELLEILPQPKED